MPDGPGYSIRDADDTASEHPLRVFTLADIRAMPERDYIVKGLISPGELSVWWGPPKCGKSFLMSHIAYAIAQGRNVFGRRVRSCPVLYVAAEGQAGYGRRLRALSAAYGDAPEWFMILQAVDLFQLSGDIEGAIQAARSCGAKLIVIDTLNRVMPGGDENAPDDMGRFISNMDRIRTETGAHVAIVHHSGKDAARGMRGHSSLLGAADLVVAITKPDHGPPVAVTTHAKDDAIGHPMVFSLDAIALGNDADGDPLTTCLVRESGPCDTLGPMSRLPPVAQRALDILHDTIAGGKGSNLPAGDGFPIGIRGCQADAWYAECETCQLSSAQKEKDRQRVRREAVEKLLAARKVMLKDGWVWPCEDRGD